MNCYHTATVIESLFYLATLTVFVLRLTGCDRMFMSPVVLGFLDLSKMI